jgi:tripartite-type tricarboxylate transporter receptor subunit TctC
MHTRRSVVATLPLAALATLLGGQAALAQQYPAHPIRFVVPFAAGGSSDVVARLVGEQLNKSLGQPIIIDNKPGAGAVLGADVVAKSAPDGYTLLYTTAGPQITNPYLMPKLPYDPFKDFTPVAMLVKSVNILVVNPSVPAKTVSELIAYAKANPGKLSFSSSGVGASSHLAAELFKEMANIDLVHVPYRGTGPAIQDLVAGNVQMTIDTVSVLLPHIQAGSLRALGFATPERNVVLPDVPPIADTLTGFDGSSINYVSAPSRTPQPIIDRLNKEINAVLADPVIGKRLIDMGIIPVIESPAQLGARIGQEQEKWKQVIARMNTKAQ